MLTITREQAYRLRELIEKAVRFLSDEDALDGVALFPAWKSDTDYSVGERIKYGGKLYRVVQAHTSQETWTPDITPALYTRVERSGQGDTPTNPIPYNGNMELVEGKYYAQDGVVYICFRSTGTPVFNDLKDLVEIYVREVVV